MVDSFIDQYAKRNGVFATKTPKTETGTPAAPQPSIIDKVKGILGMASQQPEQKAPSLLPPAQSYQPSLYDQAKTAQPAGPQSFIDQYDTGTGIFSETKPGDSSAGPEAQKRASMAAFLDATPAIVRQTGESSATVAQKTKASPFALPSATSTFGFQDQQQPAADKPHVSMLEQDKLDTPDFSKLYVQGVESQQPKNLVDHLAEGFSKYIDALGTFSENVSIGELASAQSLLDFVGLHAGDLGGLVGVNAGQDANKLLGVGATKAADNIQAWIDRAEQPDTVISGLDKTKATLEAEKLAKQSGQRPMVVPTHENRGFAPSLYGQKDTYDVVMPKYGTFTDQLAQGIGSSALFFLPGLGVARGAEVLGAVSPRIALLFGNSASAALEAMSESGNIYRAEMTQGLGASRASEDATKSFWANVFLVGLTNHFGAFNPETSGFIRRMVMSAPVEGVQEAAQQVIQNALQGNDLMQGTGSSFLIGGIVGGIMGGGVEHIMGESGGQSIVHPTLTPEMLGLPGGAATETAKIDAGAKESTGAAPEPQTPVPVAPASQQAAAEQTIFDIAGLNEKTQQGDGSQYQVRFTTSKRTGNVSVEKYIISADGSQNFVDAIPLEKAQQKYQTTDRAAIAQRIVNPFVDYNFQTETYRPPKISKPTPAKPGSNTFRVYALNENKSGPTHPSGFYDVEGEPVDLGIAGVSNEFFIHRPINVNGKKITQNTKAWAVSERSSGALISEEPTRAGAIDSAKKKIQEVGPEGMRQAIQKYRAFTKANIGETASKSSQEIADTYYGAVIEPLIGSGKTIEVSGDLMKEYFGGDYAPERSDIYAAASYDIIQRLIEDPRTVDFAFLGGGPGSGKSEFLGEHIKAGGATDVLYDTTLSNEDGTRALINLAKENKKGLEIYSILADPEKAWAFTQKRAGEKGRGVSPEAFVRGHIGFVDSLRGLLKSGDLVNEQVLLFDLRGIADENAAREMVENRRVVDNALATLEGVSYTQEYVQGITAQQAPSGNVDTGGGGIAGEVPQAVGTDQGRAEVLTLKPEDLDKQVEVEMQRLTGEGMFPAIARKQARESVRRTVEIQGERVPRPEQIVTKTGIRDIFAAAGTDSLEFTVEEERGAKYLTLEVRKETSRSSMKIKATALGLVGQNLKAGAIVRVNAAELKAKGTALRAHGSSGALAFNIKNLGAGVDSKAFEIETDKIVKRSEIATNLAKELGVPVRTGNFKERALGIFKPWAHVIRLHGKLGNMRIPVLVHESAHYIDYTLFGKPTKTKKGTNWTSTSFVSDMIPRAELDPLLVEYGGTPKSKKREAFAEFVRYWVTEPDRAGRIAPEFTQTWEEQILPQYPEVRDVLLQTRADWQRYNTMPAAAKVVSQISFGTKAYTMQDFKEAVVETWHDQLARWVDDLYPVRRFTNMARERGAQFSLEEDPYILARLSRGWLGKANVFLEKGTFDVRFWQEKNGKSEPVFTGKGLGEIIAPAVQTHTTADLSAYLVAKRAIELQGRGIHSGIDAKVASDAVTELAQKHPEFEDIARDLQKYQDSLLTYIQHSGLIDVKTVQKMRELNKEYVPYYRVMEEAQRKGLSGRTMVDLSTPVKRIKGSDRDIIDPLESIVKNTYALVNAAERNRVGMAMVNLSKKHPELAQLFEPVPESQSKVASVKISDLIDQVAAGTYQGDIAKQALGDVGEQLVNIFRPSFVRGDNILTVMVGGKQQSFYVDPEIYKALHGSEVEEVGFIWKILSYPARWLRAGATLTPEFIVRNPARDLVSAYVYSNYSFMPPADIPRGLYGMYTKDSDYWLWRMGGGEQSMLVSLDRTTLQKTYEELAAEHDFKSLSGVITLGKEYGNPLELLRLASEFTEKMTRLGEAKKAIAQGANPLEAAYSSREVTLDFAKMGSKGRALNAIIAFFNANVQGTVRMVNAFKDAPYRTTVKTALGLTLPSVLLALWNRQEPDWQEIPQWQKDLFWLVKINGSWWRFPKPFELGILFGSIPERTMESILDSDPTVWPDLRQAALDGMTPGFLPTSVQPVVENISNYSFFLGRNIVPQSTEQLPAFAQYTAYSSETSKLIGRWLNYSPAKIDNLIQGYFAGLGRYATQGLDKILEHTQGIKAPPAPTGTAADIPLVKAFAVRKPIGSSSESVARFYNKAEDALAAANYFKSLAQNGSTAESKQWYADHAAEIVLSPFYEKVRKQLSTIRNVQVLVRDAPNISPAEKRDRIDKLDQLLTDIAHLAITVNIGTADGIYQQINEKTQ